MERRSERIFGQRYGCRQVRIAELNEHLLCALCGGYYIDATTIVECLHSFCRSCIVRYLERNSRCPVCDVLIHKAQPLLNVRLDHVLQGLVYKLVPGLLTKELNDRREFYLQGIPNKLNDRSNEMKDQSGKIKDQSSNTKDRLNIMKCRTEMKDRSAEYVSRASSRSACDDSQQNSSKSHNEPHTDFESLSISLEYCASSEASSNSKFTVSNVTAPKISGLKDVDLCLNEGFDVRYLLCPAGFTVRGLKKFIRAKFDLPLVYQIDIFHSGECLDNHYSMLDIAFIFQWQKKAPLRLWYSVSYAPRLKRKLLTSDSTEPQTPKQNETLEKCLNTGDHEKATHSNPGQTSSQISFCILKDTKMADNVAEQQNSLSVQIKDKSVSKTMKLACDGDNSQPIRQDRIQTTGNSDEDIRTIQRMNNTLTKDNKSDLIVKGLSLEPRWNIDFDKKVEDATETQQEISGNSRFLAHIQQQSMGRVTQEISGQAAITNQAELKGIESDNNMVIASAKNNHVIDLTGAAFNSSVAKVHAEADIVQSEVRCNNYYSDADNRVVGSVQFLGSGGKSGINSWGVNQVTLNGNMEKAVLAPPLPCASGVDAFTTLSCGELQGHLGYNDIYGQTGETVVTADIMKIISTPNVTIVPPFGVQIFYSSSDAVGSQNSSYCQLVHVAETQISGNCSALVQNQAWNNSLTENGIVNNIDFQPLCHTETIDLEKQKQNHQNCYNQYVMSNMLENSSVRIGGDTSLGYVTSLDSTVSLPLPCGFATEAEKPLNSLSVSESIVEGEKVTWSGCDQIMAEMMASHTGAVNCQNIWHNSDGQTQANVRSIVTENDAGKAITAEAMAVEPKAEVQEEAALVSHSSLTAIGKTPPNTISTEITAAVVLTMASEAKETATEETVEAMSETSVAVSVMHNSFLQCSAAEELAGDSSIKRSPLKDWKEEQQEVEIVPEKQPVFDAKSIVEETGKAYFPKPCVLGDDTFVGTGAEQISSNLMSTSQMYFDLTDGDELISFDAKNIQTSTTHIAHIDASLMYNQSYGGIIQEPMEDSVISLTDTTPSLVMKNEGETELGEGNKSTEDAIYCGVQTVCDMPMEEVHISKSASSGILSEQNHISKSSVCRSDENIMFPASCGTCLASDIELPLLTRSRNIDATSLTISSPGVSIVYCSEVNVVSDQLNYVSLIENNSQLDSVVTDDDLVNLPVSEIPQNTQVSVKLGCEPPPTKLEEAQISSRMENTAEMDEPTRIEQAQKDRNPIFTHAGEIGLYPFTVKTTDVQSSCTESCKEYFETTCKPVIAETVSITLPSAVVDLPVYSADMDITTISSVDLSLPIPSENLDICVPSAYLNLPASSMNTATSKATTSKETVVTVEGIIQGGTLAGEMLPVAVPVYCPTNIIPVQLSEVAVSGSVFVDEVPVSILPEKLLVPCTSDLSVPEMTKNVQFSSVDGSKSVSFQAEALPVSVYGSLSQDCTLIKHSVVTKHPHLSNLSAVEVLPLAVDSMQSESTLPCSQQVSHLNLVPTDQKGLVECTISGNPVSNRTETGPLSPGAVPIFECLTVAEDNPSCSNSVLSRDGVEKGEHTCEKLQVDSNLVNKCESFTLVSSYDFANGKSQNSLTKLNLGRLNDVESHLNINKQSWSAGGVDELSKHEVSLMSDNEDVVITVGQEDEAKQKVYSQQTSRSDRWSFPGFHGTRFLNHVLPSLCDFLFLDRFSDATKYSQNSYCDKWNMFQRSGGGYGKGDSEMKEVNFPEMRRRSRSFSAIEGLTWSNTSHLNKEGDTEKEIKQNQGTQK